MLQSYRPRGIHTANMPADEPADHLYPAAAPFITISPQRGAECTLILGRLIEALDRHDPAGKRWTLWDRNLITRAADVGHLPAEVIESLENSPHSLVDDLLVAVGVGVQEMSAFHPLRQAVRELAQAGHVVIVGHGSAHMTRNLPGGLHIRLIAPMRYRIVKVAEEMRKSPMQAARHIRQLEKKQRAFFARYWPGMPLEPEMFSATFNVAEFDEEAIVQALVAMVPPRRPHHHPHAEALIR